MFIANHIFFRIGVSSYSNNLYFYINTYMLLEKRIL